MDRNVNAERNGVKSRRTVSASGDRRDFWRPLVRSVLNQESAPFYLFASAPAWQAVAELEGALTRIPVQVRHWLSFKTQPLRPWVQEWIRRGRSVEVVSAFELQAVLKEGLEVDRILVNGPAKQSWLPQLARPGQRVHFDSLLEIKSLLPLARKQQWRVGLRLLTTQEFDIENSRGPTQFGLAPGDAAEAMRLLRKAGVAVQGIHFHLRTNVPSPSIYQQAFNEASALCKDLGIQPGYVDAGGGLPPPHVLTKGRLAYDREFGLEAWALMLRQALRQFPEVKELWLENGRFISARSGVLVLRVLDIKERLGVRHLICNAGRTMNALVSTWEIHDLWPLARRRGPGVRTIVSGPTCMAFDQIFSGELPRSLKPGDHLVWMDAGAYHLPWETRFSHGLAPVWWQGSGETQGLEQVRKRESFEEWWSQWL